jgi:hypothetical protein
MLFDFDAAALDQHQLITLAGSTGRADVDLPRGVDGVLIPGRSEHHADIVRWNVLVALITGSKY